jgi:hypothetical protein
MNTIDKAIARHRRRSKSGRSWYAEHWQGPHPAFSAHYLNQRILESTRALGEHIRVMYGPRYYFDALTTARSPLLDDIGSLPEVPLGLAVAAAAVLAPGPVDRRGFLARALAAVTGAASAVLTVPAPEEPAFGPTLMYGAPVRIIKATAWDFPAPRVIRAVPFDGRWRGGELRIPLEWEGDTLKVKA